jgi:hypothetical protein
MTTQSDAQSVCAAGQCEWCGCHFRKPSDVLGHRCAAMQAATEVEAGPLLKARLEYEAANPRPETLVRAEKAIVRALVAEGFGRQYQVTRDDSFEIAVDDLLIRVRVDPDFGLDGPPCAVVHEKAGAVCTRPTGHEGYHANSQGYWL